MSTFSQRNGYVSAQKALQREQADEALRTILWNKLKIEIFDKAHVQPSHGFDSDYLERTKLAPLIEGLIQRVWNDVLGEDLDILRQAYALPNTPRGYQELRNRFFGGPWYLVYDILEYLCSNARTVLHSKWQGRFNQTLSKAGSAYRFVDDLLAEITNSNEIQAIEEAIQVANDPVRTHLETALKMLSDRETPDFRNSIKESISAVEAACKLIAGNTDGTLGVVIKKVESIHPSLARAFSNLYGFTSNAGGIRHALMDEDTVSFAEAKFMLVTCSAFINYLKLACPQNPA